MLFNVVFPTIVSICILVSTARTCKTQLFFRSLVVCSIQPFHVHLFSLFWCLLLLETRSRCVWVCSFIKFCRGSGFWCKSCACFDGFLSRVFFQLFLDISYRLSCCRHFVDAATASPPATMFYNWPELQTTSFFTNFAAEPIYLQPTNISPNGHGQT